MDFENILSDEEEEDDFQTKEMKLPPIIPNTSTNAYMQIQTPQFEWNDN